MTPLNSRRTFLAGLAAIGVARGLRAAGTARLPIAFSTLGCPGWNLTRVLDEADRLGYAAIELRGLEGEMDLTHRPELQGTAIAETKRRLADHGLVISDLGASAHMHEADAVARAAQLDEGRRFIDLAHELGVPYVRVFGDKLVAGEPKEKTVARVVDGLRTLGEHAKGSGVSVLIESHGDFAHSGDLKAILTAVSLPTVALLWDAHHTFVLGKEAPADTWRAVGSFVRHTHLKDSRPEGADVRYVLTGEGTVPVRDTVRVLMEGGYKGYYCYEWEKKWHPEIEEPEIAFPHYAKTLTGYLNAARQTVK